MLVMHRMRKTGRKKGEQESVMNLDGYCLFQLEEHVLWEQEVGGTNPLAPTNKINYL